MDVSIHLLFLSQNESTKNHSLTFLLQSKTSLTSFYFYHGTREILLKYGLIASSHFKASNILATEEKKKSRFIIISFRDFYHPVTIYLPFIFKQVASNSATFYYFYRSFCNTPKMCMPHCLCSWSYLDLENLLFILL